MSDTGSRREYVKAMEDFRQMRAKARLQHLWAEVTGESKELLRFDEITTRMQFQGSSSKGIKDIPVSTIVGSVNRYQDFDRNFLPLRDEDMQRWARVKTAMTSIESTGLDPIRVYKIGEVYFVLDGNHRVSIARQMGIETIEAYVTEIKIRVHLSPEDTPEDVILKAEYSDFLEKSKFDKIFPEAELNLTFPGQYETLIEHIRVHRYYMGLDQEREIAWEEAVRHWYENVYQPLVEVIHDLDILYEFPERTETDLYIWVLDHQTYLEEKLGWSIRPEKAASDLVYERSERFFRVVQRFIKDLLSKILPKQLEDFSSPGEWHLQKRTNSENLFTDILVALSGSSDSWVALDQALVLARYENANVRGLMVEGNSEIEQLNEEDIRNTFEAALEAASVEGKLAFAHGNIAETICDRAKFNDLVILKLNHPPSTNIFARLGSGIRMIVRSSTRPLMVVRDQPSQMNHLLLAYDGSPKGKEALYISAYLACRYNKQLSVVVVDEEEEQGLSLLSEAEEYLDGCYTHTVFRQSYGRVSKIILDVADEKSADMILMGGYGLSPILEALFGSTVDGVLRGTTIPVLVCK